MYCFNNVLISPELRAPPAVTTDGEPVKPVPEKTFLQKYWMYLVPLLIVLRQYHLLEK